MNESRWDRLEALLEQGRSLPRSARSAFVDREAADDPDLRAELRELLEASEGAAEYLDGLREDLLGSAVQGILRAPPPGEVGPDPWIGRTVSHYQIVDRIGDGGMGVVYRARDLTLDRPVALKFIAPEIRRDGSARERFLLEARAASALDHPNICTIHEIAETPEGLLFIVMAAYQGESLRSRIERDAVPDAEALDVAEQIARALAAAHERGIVHRDVKPENVFVTDEGVVKLLDFGLARAARGRLEGGVVEGTVAYMSPEQAGGEAADQRTDVWSLGVVLFEMLARVRPFTGGDTRAVIDQVLTREPDLPSLRPDLPRAVLRLVDRMLAKDREARFAGGREVLEALAACRADEGALAHRGAGRGRRPRVPVAALALVAVAGVFVRSDWSGPGRGARPSSLGAVSHVLWVDDNPRNNAGIVARLRARGVEVTTALSTDEALSRYDPAVHRLVVSDMGRYEGSGGAYVGRAGFDLLGRLKARHSGVRLVFCTSGRAAAAYRAEALSAGALAILEECGEIVRMVGF